MISIKSIDSKRILRIESKKTGDSAKLVFYYSKYNEPLIKSNASI